MNLIGYQGIEGSNSQQCSVDMAENLSMNVSKFIPLIHSKGVVEALKNKDINYGVMAIKNSVAGEVIETANALKKLNFKIIDTNTLPIHHCLFVKNNLISLNNIQKISSHIQALKQCKSNLSKLLPNAQWIEVEDTAIAAKFLSDGTLSDDTAILCRKNAGENFGLHLIKENIEDDKNNFTDFIMIELE